MRETNSRAAEAAVADNSTISRSRSNNASTKKNRGKVLEKEKKEYLN